MNILFFGSSSFSLPILDTLLKSKHKVCGVITTPDKKSGRGQKVHPTPVKEFAKRFNLKCLTPSQLEDKSTVNTIKDLGADIIIVVAYGKILPKTILSLSKKMPLNIHPSLLPKYRGAAPIAQQLINGEGESGVTFISMNENIDEGDIIFQETLSIDDNDDFENLSEKLSTLAAKRIETVIKNIESGDVSLVKQDEKLSSYAHKINKTDGLIKWGDTAQNIRNKIRAFVTWPGAYTFFQGERIKIVKSSGWKEHCGTIQPGEILAIHKEGTLEVETGKGTIVLDEIQPEGKKKMSAYDFCLGRKVKIGNRFGD